MHCVTIALKIACERKKEEKTKQNSEQLVCSSVLHLNCDNMVYSMPSFGIYVCFVRNQNAFVLICIMLSSRRESIQLHLFNRKQSD